MRQLKVVLLAVFLLTFVGGLGTGAWIGSLVAQQQAPREPDSVDRRVRDFGAYFDLTPTQRRQLREVLADHDRRKERIRQLTPEQFRRIRELEDESRARIRALLDPAQRKKYDALNERR